MMMRSLQPLPVGFMMLPASDAGCGYGATGEALEQAASVGGRGGRSAASKKKARSGPKSRTSPYVGVSQYKRTGRWESHIWDASDSPDGKGRQLHLGSFLTAVQAARAYDRAALIMRGDGAEINFPHADYTDDDVLQGMRQMSKKQMLMTVRKTLDTPEEQAATAALAGTGEAAGAAAGSAGGAWAAGGGSAGAPPARRPPTAGRGPSRAQPRWSSYFQHTPSSAPLQIPGSQPGPPFNDMQQLLYSGLHQHQQQPDGRELPPGLQAMFGSQHHPYTNAHTHPRSSSSDHAIAGSCTAGGDRNAGANLSVGAGVGDTPLRLVASARLIDEDALTARLAAGYSAGGACGGCGGGGGDGSGGGGGGGGSHCQEGGVLSGGGRRTGALQAAELIGNAEGCCAEVDPGGSGGSAWQCGGDGGAVGVGPEDSVGCSRVVPDFSESAGGGAAGGGMQQHPLMTASQTAHSASLFPMTPPPTPISPTSRPPWWAVEQRVQGASWEGLGASGEVSQPELCQHTSPLRGAPLNSTGGGFGLMSRRVSCPSELGSYLAANHGCPSDPWQHAPPSQPHAPPFLAFTAQQQSTHPTDGAKGEDVEHVGGGCGNEGDGGDGARDDDGVPRRRLWPRMQRLRDAVVGLGARRTLSAQLFADVSGVEGSGESDLGARDSSSSPSPLPPASPTTGGDDLPSWAFRRSPAAASDSGGRGPAGLPPRYGAMGGDAPHARYVQRTLSSPGNLHHLSAPGTDPQEVSHLYSRPAWASAPPSPQPEGGPYARCRLLPDYGLQPLHVPRLVPQRRRAPSSPPRPPRWPPVRPTLRASADGGLSPNAQRRLDAAAMASVTGAIAMLISPSGSPVAPAARPANLRPAGGPASGVVRELSMDVWNMIAAALSPPPSPLAARSPHPAAGTTAPVHGPSLNGFFAAAPPAAVAAVQYASPAVASAQHGSETSYAHVVWQPNGLFQADDGMGLELGEEEDEDEHGGGTWVMTPPPLLQRPAEAPAPAVPQPCEAAPGCDGAMDGVELGLTRLEAAEEECCDDLFEMLSSPRWLPHPLGLDDVGAGMRDSS